MKQYHVTGMSCAACSARVEKAVCKVPGVESCSVSLLTNSMGVEGTAESMDIIRAVEAAGYGASEKSGMRVGQAGSAVNGPGSSTASGQGAFGAASGSLQAAEDALADRETPLLKKRLFTSLGFLLVLMYFSMGHMMWGWPVPAYFADNHVAMGLLQLLLTAAVMIINQRFFISGFKSLWHKAPNMDTLVALGSGAAFVYSTYALFAMTGAQAKGDMAAVMEYMHEFYFESAAMILTLITVGKMLEARSKGKTTDALKGLMKLAPKTANVVRSGVEEQIAIDAVVKGDIFVVRPGENIPVDGVVLEGSSAVNEAALTGESIPVDKAAGDMVSAATLNQSGFLTCEATRVGEDTTLSQIIQMVSDAAATKAPIAKVADKVSGVFVPVVITIALFTIGIWLLAGESVGFALARGISVLVISCPCALGLATPVAIMVGNGVGANHGIMFKTAVSLEEAGKVNTVVLDKTGTITSGEPRVTDMIPVEGVTEEELFTLAYALERKSEHPLAKAILLEAKERRFVENQEEQSGAHTEERVLIEDLVDFQALPGNGLTAKRRMQGDEAFAGQELAGGNYEFISTKCMVPSEVKAQADTLSGMGKTPLYFAEDGQLKGIIAVADVMKAEAPQAISELKNMGIRVVMLTGDNPRTAQAIGKEAGVDEVIAGVLPDGKEEVVRTLKQKGKVAMVGDGINDAPALTRADIGIAIGAGTDIAIDAADVVLMKSKLSDVPAAIRLSRAILKNIHENLFWAFFYNIIGIPLAAGLWIPFWGWELNPMFGAAAMSLSSFCVVSNALRLNFCKVYDASHDKKIKRKKVEEKNMTRTMKIEGMMCKHCEARVKKVLEALPEVAEAVVSHEAGTAVVTLNAELANDVLKKAVEEQDYPVISIE
ncbi:MAG: heavy metal translocating P-type ATPase [Lachnospiraceae bacterium]|nr:heavy metal translocating P-type ATPase [Lachnospiraceae bacterium]